MQMSTAAVLTDSKKKFGQLVFSVASAIGGGDELLKKTAKQHAATEQVVKTQRVSPAHATVKEY